MDEHILLYFSTEICLFVLAGFLFLYHLHGRSMLDVHVHQLLLYATFGDAFVAFLEVFHRGNILLELLRCTFTLLQGSWFWQVNLNVCRSLWPVLNNSWHCSLSLFGLRLVLCCTLPMALSGTLRIITIWCSSPCVTRGTSPSPCSPWACSIAPSAGKNLLHTNTTTSDSSTQGINSLWCLSCFLCSVVRSRLKRTPPMEMGLLKPRERDPESEDEILWGGLLYTHSWISQLNQGHDGTTADRKEIRTWFLDALYISTSAFFNQLTTSVSLPLIVNCYLFYCGLMLLLYSVINFFFFFFIVNVQPRYNWTWTHKGKLFFFFIDCMLCKLFLSDFFGRSVVPSCGGNNHHRQYSTWKHV